MQRAIVMLATDRGVRGVINATGVIIHTALDAPLWRTSRFGGSRRWGEAIARSSSISSPVGEARGGARSAG